MTNNDTQSPKAIQQRSRRPTRNRMKRYGMLIKVKKDSIARYKEYHAKVWPEVLATIRACNIKNYSIF